ncbi:MAG: hypothetical protein WCF57_10535 [Pyrinomonadaceae bacterium]
MDDSYRDCSFEIELESAKTVSTGKGRKLSFSCIDAPAARIVAEEFERVKRVHTGAPKNI